MIINGLIWSTLFICSKWNILLNITWFFDHIKNTHLFYQFILFSFQSFVRCIKYSHRFLRDRALLFFVQSKYRKLIFFALLIFLIFLFYLLRSVKSRSLIPFRNLITSDLSLIELTNFKLPACILFQTFEWIPFEKRSIFRSPFLEKALIFSFEICLEHWTCIFLDILWLYIHFIIK